MYAVQADRRGRLGLIIERDEPTCVWCGRLKGGPSWMETEVAACRRWLMVQLRRLGRQTAC